MALSLYVCVALFLTTVNIATGQFVGCDNDTYQCYVCVNPPCYGNGQSYTVCAAITCASLSDTVCVSVPANAPPTCFSSVTNQSSVPVTVCTTSVCNATSCSVNVTSSGSACNVTSPTVVANRQYASDRYSTPLAVQTRQRHFYCSGFGQNGVAGYPDSVAQNGSYWTVFFQFPLLSYMDNARKWALFQVLLETANSGSSLGSLCVGNYTQYGVSTYNEGMLLHLYFNNSAVNTDALNAQFVKNITDANYKTFFLGKRALSIAAYWNSYQIQPNTDVQAYFLKRPTGFGLPADQDPTLFAVYLGSWAGYVPLESIVSSVQGNFAINPNPVDYGLEVGDYFFAVFGSIFVFLLLVVVVLGFVIHPLFLDD